MKPFQTLVLVFLLLLIPLSAFSLVFLKIDERGNHFFACERSIAHPIHVKLIEKNVYKVLGRGIGKVIHAKSESEAALIACGEDGKTKNQSNQ